MIPIRRLIASIATAALLAAGMAGTARADDIPAPATIGTEQYLGGSFTMDRHLDGFEKPLTSNGDFVLSPANGLVWRTLAPFPGTTILDDHGITRIDDQGNRDELARGDQFRQFVELISAVLAGNWQPLEQRFDIAKDTTEQGAWKVILTPKDGSTIQNQISKITATGTDFVENVRLEKPTGDHDAITLSDQALQGLPLPPEFADLLTGPVQ
ncbi:outer membrane lipoprotein carrier protein LolA [Thalassospira sp. A3_1]|uniref:LolA family protein n=1 Tax=Thalassospira sp. A3_1 TaxID=2821088 RepID=UPI001ADB89A7|nr:outer membrane lipoprotein carrier protein LolA [Thalassospira sp. A3_1]MBO9509243.1 outer membrane lipoprotein carrier protein LolA [Thalassospira sp. A3_1]